MSSESSYSIIYRKITGKSKFDTLKNILSAIKSGTRKTYIINTQNLNCDQLEVYLSLLLEIGLLNSDLTDKNKFIITDRGQEFLKDYAKLKMILD